MKDHPLEVFRYCPKCGSNDFKIHNALSRHCANCGFTYYQNPRASTAAFIINGKGELLVARRGKEPAKGTLDLPGGFVDNNENAEQGMVREIQEETGLVISADDVKEDAEVKAADDAAELTWLPLRQVYVERFGLRSIREAVHRFLNVKSEKVKR